MWHWRCRTCREAKRELDRLGVKYWTLAGVVGPHLEQIFMDDPFGNMIQLHLLGHLSLQQKRSEYLKPFD